MKKVILSILFVSLFVKMAFSTEITADTEASYNFTPYTRHVEPQKVEVNEPDYKSLNLALEDDPVLGTLRFIDLFECKDMVYKRGIFIWLPEGFTMHNGPYAVLYMHDARNLFIPSESVSGKDWKVDETLTNLMNLKEIKNCIVVAIPNSPKRDSELNIETRDGKAYDSFIVKEVMPFIQKNYPVSTKREDHIIVGGSLGGLMAFQMAYAHPTKFGGAICISPTFMTQVSNIIEVVKSNKKQPHNLKIYIDTGDGKEESEPLPNYKESIFESYRNMYIALAGGGFKENVNLKSHIQKGGQHNSQFFGERLGLATKFMLPR